MNTRYLGLTTGSQNVAEVAEGVELDGATDYLSRSSDFTGNVDSKTFTFSCWVYVPPNTSSTAVYSTGETGTTTTGYFYIQINNDNNAIGIYGYNSSGALVLSSANAPSISVRNGWNNISVSIDLALTTSRHIYLNDLDITNLFGWTTYINSTIGFTNTKHRVGTTTYGDAFPYFKGRLSNVFLDYTYRDLSIEANRRLFITADGKPTPTETLKALNPILYLPMKDASTAHINEGTGGDFVQNGTLDTASRGANQDNCVASYLNGTSQYLSRTSLTGIADGKQFAFSFNYKTNSTAQQYAFEIADSTTGRFNVLINNTELTINGYNSAGTRVLFIGTPATLGISKNIYVSVSVDMSDVNKCHIIINGSAVVVNKYTFTVDSIIDFLPNTPVTNIRRKTNASGYVNGNIGEVYFDTKYIDLATSNPFWDSDANRPKPVRQVIRETGATPLIAMPLDASNAGKNYGIGGDFTANGGPYVGARGASEFWARSAKSNGTPGTVDNHLVSSNLGVSSNKFSFILCLYYNYSIDTGSRQLIGLNQTGIGESVVGINISNTSGHLNLRSIYGGTWKLNVTVESLTANAWNIIMCSIDLSNISNRYIGILGKTTTVTWGDYANTELPFNSGNNYIFKQTSDTDLGSISFDNMASVYFTTDYIDFSQEVNRLKFVDGLGYPLDLSKQIESGAIPNPLIYLPFDDTSNLGKNLGTGGDFTVNGTVTAGADFSL